MSRPPPTRGDGEEQGDALSAMTHDLPAHGYRDQTRWRGLQEARQVAFRPSSLPLQGRGAPR